MQAYSVSIDFRHFYVDLFRKTGEGLSCGAYAYVRATHFNFKRGHTYETAKIPQVYEDILFVLLTTTTNTNMHAILMVKLV